MENKNPSGSSSEGPVDQNVAICDDHHHHHPDYSPRQDKSKSPSPALSADLTTGTTTTPTSQRSDNVSREKDDPTLMRDPVPTIPDPHRTDATFSTDGSLWMGAGDGGVAAAAARQQQQEGVVVSDYGVDMQHAAPPIFDQQAPQRYSHHSFPAAIKLLVSNNVAGSIIGRQGRTISELQKDSATRIKLSQAGDYYPGTQDRVCLVQGEADNCKKALHLLLQRFYMLQEHQHSQHLAWQLRRQQGAAPTFDFVIRLLVPVSCCGMIIGKSGSNIKYMEEHMGVTSVRLSPKESNEGAYAGAIVPATSERVVTITGPDMESCLRCSHHILDGMMAHPDISRYANMTTGYSRVAPEVFSPPNRQLLVPAPPTPVSVHLPTTDSVHWEQTLPQVNPFAPPPDGLQRRFASSPDLPGMMAPRTPESVEVQRTDRLGDLPVAPPVPYPSLQHSINTAPDSTATPVQQAPLYLHQTPETLPDGRPAEQHVAHSASAPDLLAFQLEHSMTLNPVATPLGLPTPSPPAPQEYGGEFVSHPPAMVAPGCFNSQLVVPDAMIGSILGRGGSTLTELEAMSGTKIRASQRGDFVPGTRSRLVSIRGPTAQAVWQAQFMISQHMMLPPTASYAHPIGTVPDQQLFSGSANNTDNSDEKSRYTHSHPHPHS